MRLASQVSNSRSCRAERGVRLASQVLNAFLDDVTFESTEAENLIKQVILNAGEVMRRNLLENIDEVFQPIFSIIQTVSMTEREGCPAIPSSISSSGETDQASHPQDR